MPLSESGTVSSWRSTTSTHVLSSLKGSEHLQISHHRYKIHYNYKLSLLSIMKLGKKIVLTDNGWIENFDRQRESR